MTKTDLLKYQLTHARGGNGWACVQFDPEGDGRYVRVMDATMPHRTRQAFLAALSQLSPFMLSPGKEASGANAIPVPAKPVKLDAIQLGHLQPFRDGLADGTLKCVLSHVVPAKKATAALV